MIKIGREDVELVGQDMKMMSRLGYGFKSELDHTPHALFIEMDELEGEEWEERARWIKYEEDLEAERGEWGKPHVSSLTFHSLSHACQASPKCHLRQEGQDLEDGVVHFPPGPGTGTSLGYQVDSGCSRLPHFRG